MRYAYEIMHFVTLKITSKQWSKIIKEQEKNRFLKQKIESTSLELLQMFNACFLELSYPGDKCFKIFIDKSDFDRKFARVSIFYDFSTIFWIFHRASKAGACVQMLN